MGEWRRRWPQIRAGGKGRGKLWLLILLLGIFAVPWNFEVNGQGLMRSARHYPLFAPGPARVWVAWPAAVRAASSAPCAC